MSPYTKTKVSWIRWTQLTLRICALLGAIGMLICVICLKSMDDTLAWIVRITVWMKLSRGEKSLLTIAFQPGISILHTVYAVYHLARSSKGRTPASSASYMLFAAIVDAGLLPFLVFAAMTSHTQYILPASGVDHWQTLFNDDVATMKVIYATFLISVTSGGLHLTSLCISIYLALLFRKISKLPPDMNPLEDNLTSRHKRNKSSIPTVITEKPRNRESNASDPLMDSPRTIPFLHTRNNSSPGVSTPQRRSGPDHSNRASRTNLTELPNRHSRQRSQPGKDGNSRGMVPSPIYEACQELPAQRTSYAGYSPSLAALSPTRPVYEEIRSHSPAPSVQIALGDHNWITYPSPSPSPVPAGPPEFQHLRVPHDTPSLSSNPKWKKYDVENIDRRPLEMNPPTPVAMQSRSLTEQRALTPLSANALAYESSPRHSGPPMSQSSSLSEKKHQSPPHKTGRPHHRRNDSIGVVANKARFYGELHGGMSKESRVVSSGADVHSSRANMRAREVSGKVVEEGRSTAGVGDMHFF